MKAANGRLKRGQVLVLFVFFVIAIAAICVLAIDVGWLLVCKAQLQNAVDSAALAGASQLTGCFSEQERQDASTEARALAAANRVGGLPLTLTGQDIEFGHCDPDTMAFTPEPEATVVDSIRVTGRRTPNSPDGPVPLCFGGLFGWDELEMSGVVATGTKPRRYAMFVLDRSGSMCFDTSGVQLEPYLAPQDENGPYMQTSALGWYWFPELALKDTGYGWLAKTAWFYARDNETGDIRTDFLPDHIKAHLEAGRYFNFRPPDYPTQVMSGWLKVPADVTIYGRWGSPWHYWLADDYYHVISSTCGYARTTSPVQPLQNAMDAACAFVDLLNQSDDMAGLVTFGWKGTANQVLTGDFDRLRIKLQSFVPCGATAEPDGMQAANDELIDSGRADGFGQRIEILLSDGYANMLDDTSYDSSATRTYDFLGKQVTTRIHPTVARAMEQEALRAKNAGVRIYSVTFGSDTDVEVHRQIAAATEGAYYYAEEADDLIAVFMDIFRRLPPLLTQ